MIIKVRQQSSPRASLDLIVGAGRMERRPCYYPHYIYILTLLPFINRCLHRKEENEKKSDELCGTYGTVQDALVPSNRP